MDYYYDPISNKEWHIDSNAALSLLPKTAIKKTMEELINIRIANTPPPTQQEIDDAAILTLAKGDNTIKYIVSHTSAEIDAKVRQLVNAAGVTNLASAQVCLIAIEDLLVRMALVLSVVAKDKIR
jgi:hypothetical protein